MSHPTGDALNAARGESPLIAAVQALEQRYPDAAYCALLDEVVALIRQHSEPVVTEQGVDEHVLHCAVVHAYPELIELTPKRMADAVVGLLRAHLRPATQATGGEEWPRLARNAIDALCSAAPSDSSLGMLLFSQRGRLADAVIAAIQQGGSHIPRSDVRTIDQFPPEGQRTKENEWEAAYAALFNQMQPVFDENARLRQAAGDEGMAAARGVEVLADRIRELEAENAELRDIVRFYGRREHWMGMTSDSESRTLFVAGHGECNTLDGFALAERVLARSASPPRSRAMMTDARLAELADAVGGFLHPIPAGASFTTPPMSDLAEALRYAVIALRETRAENARHRESIRCMSQTMDDLAYELGVDQDGKLIGDVDALFERIARLKDDALARENVAGDGSTVGGVG